MLRACLLDSDNNFVGVLKNDFSFQATEDCRADKISFYRDKNHLFVSEFTHTANIRATDIVKVKLTSGIAFYYLVTKSREPFKSAEDSLLLWRTIREMTEKIIHEREARRDFDSWDPQIYEVLFNEKQQPISGGDS